MSEQPDYTLWDMPVFWVNTHVATRHPDGPMTMRFPNGDTHEVKVIDGFIWVAQ